MKKLVPLFSICLLLFASCSSSDDDTPPTVTTKNFKGTVVDDLNTPIKNATIIIGDDTTMTDTNGNFVLNNVNLITDYAYIKSRKDDYISGMKMIVDLEESNTVNFTLLKDHLATILGSGGDSEVHFPTGFTLKINGNISYEDGNSFTGFMYPVIHHIAPFNLAIESIAPGHNNTFDDGNTYGFVYVKLEDAEKNRLDIKEGHTATMEFDISADLLPMSPETVKVLNFNEETGLWVNYGEATKEEVLEKWVYKTEVASFASSWFKLVAVE